MILPTPKDPSTPTRANTESANAESAGTKRADATPIDINTDDLASLARALLGELGRADHADASTNPVYALFQVAVDFRCSAQGYRDLYLTLHGADAGADRSDATERPVTASQADAAPQAGSPTSPSGR